ncbi:9880_t:CDS:2 [Paraglomus brasilianum]|uniref:9880_t:CDS:1 n=1 Tax=Paraglomus brasilianum TaxID=144538 RepID=A0A9N8ZNV2_9GLOM|nr:9880_t:CDS:2 [Paraglomus brasilianum]
MDQHHPMHQIYQIALAPPPFCVALDVLTRALYPSVVKLALWVILACLFFLLLSMLLSMLLSILLSLLLLSIEWFKASDGWITKFKKKYNLREYTKHGEARSAPSDEATAG